MHIRKPFISIPPFLLFLSGIAQKAQKWTLIIHSNQGSQFGSDEFARWCKNN